MGERRAWFEWEDRFDNLSKKNLPGPEFEHAERGDGLRKATNKYNLALKTQLS